MRPPADLPEVESTGRLVITEVKLAESAKSRRGVWDGF